MRAVFRILLLATFSLASLVTKGAKAQACCSGSSANEFGVVARGNVGLIGVRLGQEVVAWTADADGKVGYLKESTVLNTTLTLGGGVRIFTDSLQIQGALPLHLQYRSFGELSDLAYGIGDARLNLRLIVLEDDTEGAFESGSWVPFVEPYVGVGFPTGRSPAQSTTSTQADVMGTGDWRSALGLRASRFLTEQDVIFASGGWSHSFARTIERAGDARTFRLGEEFTAHLSYFRYQTLFWSFGASADYRFVTAATEDGVLTPGTGSRRFTVGAQVSHYFSWPSWQIRVAAAVDPPIDSLSKNLPFGGVSASLSLERHFGAKNEYQ